MIRYDRGEAPAPRRPARGPPHSTHRQESSRRNFQKVGTRPSLACEGRSSSLRRDRRTGVLVTLEATPCLQEPRGHELRSLEVGSLRALGGRGRKRGPVPEGHDNAGAVHTVGSSLSHLPPHCDPQDCTVAGAGVQRRRQKAGRQGSQRCSAGLCHDVLLDGRVHGHAV